MIPGNSGMCACVQAIVPKCAKHFYRYKQDHRRRLVGTVCIYPADVEYSPMDPTTCSPGGYLHNPVNQIWTE